MENSNETKKNVFDFLEMNEDQQKEFDLKVQDLINKMLKDENLKTRTEIAKYLKENFTPEELLFLAVCDVVSTYKTFKMKAKIIGIMDMIFGKCDNPDCEECKKEVEEETEN